MDWKQIEITDNDNVIHSGEKAQRFVEANCPNASIKTYKKGKMVVELPNNDLSAKPEVVRGHLEDILRGKAKGIKVKSGTKPIIVNFHVGRVVRNVVNVNMAKLKVQFIYKTDPKDSNPKKFVEDSRITVKALREGATNPLIKHTNKGIADFGAVLPGTYTITADYPESDECKYDWIDKTRKAVLQPLSAETIEFQVEPLYQKVEFIAHCLLTIPNQEYVLITEDENKAAIVEANGRKSFAFKTRKVRVGMFSKSELNPKLEYAHGEFNVNTETGSGTLKLKPKRPATAGFWRLNELPYTLNSEQVEILEQTGNNPDIYKVQFKPRFSDEQYTQDDLNIKSKWKAKYHGFVKDSEDIEARVKFVAETLEKAYAIAKQDPTILKVFIVPECFFQGLYGAYITDDAAKLVEKLQILVKDKKWKDWVFSFGTVNRVYQSLQPSSVTREQNIYEMANHAPVIRGGLGDSGYSGEGSTRLIQKLVNSAELADEDTLIKDAEAQKIRPQAVNENVQFEATENDNKVAKLLEELLPDTKADPFGLPGTLWSDLKDEIKVIIRELGIARVIRQIRTSDNSNVNSIDVKTWKYGAKDPSKKVSELLYSTKKTCLLTLDQTALMVIKTQWNKLYPALEFNKSNWEDDSSGNRRTLLEKDSSVFKNDAKECGFRLPLQQNEIAEKIRFLKDDDPVAKLFVPETLDLSFEPSVFPIWRKLLELYAESKAEEFPFKFTQSSMNLEDYCFAGPRKAGAWFAKLDKALEVKACKRMVFGLEICADHPTKRLQNLNKMPNSMNEKIGIDIHLLPSAGMPPNYFGARVGGYIFNCDGWNKAHPNGGGKIEVHFDGPSPFVEGKTNRITPVYPHSAVGKRESDSTNVPSSLTPRAEKLNTELSKVIFGYGPGELHFYEVQDLPK